MLFRNALDLGFLSQNLVPSPPLTLRSLASEPDHGHPRGPITDHTTLPTLPTFRTTKPIAPRENYSLHRCGLTTFDSDRHDARGKVLVELWTSVRLGGVCGCNRPSLGCLLPFSDSACAGSSKNPRLASSTAQCSDQLSVVLAGRSNLLAETPPLLLNAVCHQPW
jgi:hypothetical protein